MTFLDDLTDDRYADEAEARLEFSRVAAACHTCRACIDRCDAFPRVFDLLDRIDDHDAGRLTPDEQDRVADACFHCGDCLVGCADEPDEPDPAGPIDMPRAMLRLEAVRHAARRRPARDRIATTVLARPRIDRALVGTAAPGSVRRRIASASFGRSAAPPALDRPVREPAVSDGKPSVVLVTCHPHDAFDRRTVADAMALYAALGVRCGVVDLGTSGAVALQSGELDRFRRIADRNVARLSAIPASTAVVVLDPAGRAMIADEYARSLAGASRAAARAVAARTTDLASHVLASFDDRLNDPTGVVPGTVVLHADARMVASGETEATRRLLHGFGIGISLVEGTSGVGTAASLRTVKDAAVAGVAARFVARVQASAEPDDVIVSSCGATAAALRARTPMVVWHPATLLVRLTGAGGS